MWCSSSALLLHCLFPCWLLHGVIEIKGFDKLLSLSGSKVPPWVTRGGQLRVWAGPRAALCWVGWMHTVLQLDVFSSMWLTCVPPGAAAVRGLQQSLLFLTHVYSSSSGSLLHRKDKLALFATNLPSNVQEEGKKQRTIPSIQPSMNLLRLA